MTPTAAELAAWLEDALDPDRAAEIAQMVAARPALAARVRALRARLQPTIEPGERTWCLPFPGLRLPGAPRATLWEAAVMGSIGPGARFEVCIEDPEDAAQTRLVVLTRRGDDWEVIFPEEPEDDVPVSVLPLAADGRRIGLVAGLTLGEQRWALVYVARSLHIDWSAPPEQRWAPLRAALAEGAATAVVVEREVRR